jgi:site-specific DNA-methyltransferase (cytosine-N4-specific)
VLLAFCDEIGFCLAEDFYWFNPAKLPSPIEWVNKRKIRAKDAVNTVWWFSKTDFPKADVRKVLAPYSDRMKKLIEDPESFYKPQKRPSGHDISAGFGKDNGGAIPSNLLSIPNTDSNSNYLRLCNDFGLLRHPARFPAELPAFFIKMLTDEEDVVLDIFGGSNTTGYAAEALNRQWLTFELDHQYLISSVFRFLDGYDIKEIQDILVQLHRDQSNYYLENIHCSLDPVKPLKSHRERKNQMTLFPQDTNATIGEKCVQQSR